MFRELPRQFQNVYYLQVQAWEQFRGKQVLGYGSGKGNSSSPETSPSSKEDISVDWLSSSPSDSEAGDLVEACRMGIRLLSFRWGEWDPRGPLCPRMQPHGAWLPLWGPSVHPSQWLCCASLSLRAAWLIGKRTLG